MTPADPRAEHAKTFDPPEIAALLLRPHRHPDRVQADSPPNLSCAISCARAVRPACHGGRSAAPPPPRGPAMRTVGTRTSSWRPRAWEHGYGRESQLQGGIRVEGEPSSVRYRLSPALLTHTTTLRPRPIGGRRWLTITLPSSVAPTWHVSEALEQHQKSGCTSPSGLRWGVGGGLTETLPPWPADQTW